MKTHFGGGGFLKLRILRGSSKLVFLGYFENEGMLLFVFLALWRKLGFVKGEVVHHHSVLREALSHLLGSQQGKIRGNITKSRDLEGLNESKDSLQ